MVLPPLASPCSSSLPEMVPFARPFPWEILLLVFANADPPSLAALGLVSLDFLLGSAPILYRHVKVTSVARLEQLFCARNARAKALPPSTISHALSLTHLRSLALSVTSHLSPVYSLSLSFSRRSSSLPLALETFTLFIDFSSNHLFEVLHDFLLPELNPKRVAYRIANRPRSSALLPLNRISLLDGWKRLEEIELEGAIPYDAFAPGAGLGYMGQFPPPVIERRRTVRLRVATLMTHWGSSSRSLVRLVAHRGTLCMLEQMQKGSMVLVVESEEERKDVEEALLEVEADLQEKFVMELQPEAE